MPVTMTIELQTMGGMLRYAREQQGITQGDLAKLAGYAARTIGRWERDEFPIPLDAAGDLSKVLPLFDLGAYEQMAIESLQAGVKVLQERT